MLITVFTPTYNRAYIIHKLYESLKRQTCKDFEWIIVDDGSTDNTTDLANQWIKESKIPIKYIKTKNGGKHRAINIGLKETSGELFFIVDSDDFLTDNALDRVRHYYSDIQNDSAFCGLSGLRITPEGVPFDMKRSFTVIDSTDIEISKYLGGDRAQIYKTKILRHYPFPEFEGENFISESVVWEKMAQKFKVRFFAEGIYVSEYLPDGLTRNIRRKHRESPCGSMLMFKQRMMLNPHFIQKIKAGINYWRSCIGYHKRKPDLLKMPWWGYLFYPFGLYFHFYDLKSENKKTISISEK